MAQEKELMADAQIALWAVRHELCLIESKIIDMAEDGAKLQLELRKMQQQAQERAENKRRDTLFAKWIGGETHTGIKMAWEKELMAAKMANWVRRNELLWEKWKTNGKAEDAAKERVELVKMQQEDDTEENKFRDAAPVSQMDGGDSAQQQDGGGKGFDSYSYAEKPQVFGHEKCQLTKTRRRMPRRKPPRLPTSELSLPRSNRIMMRRRPTSKQDAYLDTWMAEADQPKSLMAEYF